MKKVYTILGIVVLLIIVMSLSLIKTNKTTTNSTIAKIYQSSELFTDRDLEQLLLNKNQVLSKEALIERIWGYESDAEYNNVEVYLTFIRRKLKLIESKASIKAVRGLGYKLEEKE